MRFEMNISGPVNNGFLDYFINKTDNSCILILQVVLSFLLHIHIQVRIIQAIRTDSKILSNRPSYIFRRTQIPDRFASRNCINPSTHTVGRRPYRNQMNSSIGLLLQRKTGKAMYQTKRDDFSGIFRQFKFFEVIQLC